MRICKLRRVTYHFKHFHHPTFSEKWTFFLCMLLEPCFSSQSCSESFLCGSVLPSTQHKYCTYKYRRIQNSLTLSVPLPLPSLLCTQTHMHTRFSAICMHWYERITQARKGKAELDYSGSLWHEKPTDKFLSPTTEVRIGLSNNPSYTHAYTHSQAWNRKQVGWWRFNIKFDTFYWKKCLTPHIGTFLLKFLTLMYKVLSENRINTRERCRRRDSGFEQ